MPHSAHSSALSRFTMALIVVMVVAGALSVLRSEQERLEPVVAGTPGNATELWSEDFEFNSTIAVDPPVSVVDYVGEDGTTYSASPFWSSESACNGMIVSRDSAPSTPPATLCAGSTPSWNALKILAYKLSNQFGGPGDRFTVGSYTAGSGVAPDDHVQLSTETPIAVPANGAYLTVSIDTAARNCTVGAPQYFMYLTDAAGVTQPVNSTAINPCTDPDAIVDSTLSSTALLVRSVGDEPVLVNSTSVSLMLENHNVNGAGNDTTFDNLMLLDVTPTLDKQFQSPVPYGSTTTATFTITNTYSPSGDGSFTQLDPKPGWSFTDALPSGLSIVGSPTTGAGAEACANFSSVGTTSTTLTATGDLSADQAYCTISVQVSAAAPGSYTNLASDVSTLGLKSPSDASVSFTATPGISLAKSAELVDVNTDNVTNPGDTINYSFVATNTGNVPLVDVAVTDAKAGAVTCDATTIPVGGSVSCAATAPYVLSQSEIDAGNVDNSASVSAASTFDPASTVSANDSVSTPLSPSPALQLLKEAAAPVDVNSSGITDAGDTIAYTFTVTNSGNVTLTGIRVADPLLGTVTCGAPTLAPGASTGCSAAPHAVTAAEETAGVVTNTATAYGSPPSGAEIASNTSGTSTPTTVAAPGLSFQKSAAAPVDVNESGITDAGDTIAYSFTVTNTGNVPISGIAVTDTLAGPVTCVATTLAVEASTSCTADNPYAVTEQDETAGLVTNTASASGADPDGAAVTSNSDFTASAVRTPAPQLAFSKTAAAPVDVNSSSVTDAGDTIAYSFTVTNTGNVPISSVAVTDDLVGAVTCAATTLAAGANTTCTANNPYVVTTADESAGFIYNTASATGQDPDAGPVTSNNDSTATAVTVPKPSLVFEKAAGTPVDVNSSGITDAGDTIAYTFTVTNNGNVPISEVAVTDELVGAVTCESTTLAAGAATTCTASPYVVTEADEAAGSVVNTATAAGLDPDAGSVASNEDTTTTPTTVPAPALVFNKSAGTPVDVNASGITDAGDTIAYSFTVTNSGNVPISGVAVADDKVGTVTCESTTLAAGAATTCTASPYVVTDADEAAGSVVNTATASGVDPDDAPVKSNEDTSTTVTTVPAPALAFAKYAATPVDTNSSGITDAGDTIAYTFEVINTGNVPITDLVVTDDLAGEVSCQSTTVGVDETVLCSAIAPYVVTEADEDKGSVVNTASASGRDPDNGTVASNEDTTTTATTKPDPSLVFDKYAANPVDTNSSGITDAGDTIAYTFTVTNGGNVPISDVAVRDDLAGEVTCDKAVLPVAASASCSATAPYVVTASDVESGRVLNTASAQGADPDAAAVESASDSTTTPVSTPNPSLLFEKSAAAPADVNESGIADAGDTITYSFTVTNNGNVPISDIVVSDALVDPVTCDASQLDVGAKTSCRPDKPYVITDADQEAGRVVNTAAASGIDPDNQAILSNSATTDTELEVAAPQLSLTKSAVDGEGHEVFGPLHPGDDIGYRFTVSNTGNVTVTDVVITDAMIGSSTCETTTLARGESTECVADSQYTVTDADVVAGSVRNTASASATSPDGTSPRSEATSIDVSVEATPELADTGFDLTHTWLPAAGLLALGGALMVIAHTGPEPRSRYQPSHRR